MLLVLSLSGVAALSDAACAHAIRTGPLIDRYIQAECVPLKAQPGRAWDHTLTLDDAMQVHIAGAQVPGGRIAVRFQPEGLETVAANAGDYIYPSDVRFESAANRLYVRADGRPAAFGGPQTWLFEYDLRRRQRTGRVRVALGTLPQVCEAARQ